MQRLRAYVRRYLLEMARDYAAPAKRRTPDSTRSACIDGLRGTDTGWWGDLIYTADVLAMFNRYRSDVRDSIREFIAETGTSVGDRANRDPDFPITWADMLAATGRRQTWEDYNGGSDARFEEAEAACFAIRFAVEYQAGEVARLLVPDL